MRTELCQELETEDFRDSEALKNWLQKYAQTYQLKYLLAHADDGVIWGKFENDVLTIANDVFPEFPVLDLITLQQSRIFGENAEVLLWRTDEGWRSHVLQHQAETEYIEESALLWGTLFVDEKNGFTLVSDGQQGLKHAVPLSKIQGYFGKDNSPAQRPLHLFIHHYIEYDQDGIARISFSCLVNLVITQ